MLAVNKLLDCRNNVLLRQQAWQHRSSAARPAVLASASAEPGPTLRKPELVSKPVVREAPPEVDAANKQHDATEKLSSSTATAAPCAPGGASWSEGLAAACLLHAAPVDEGLRRCAGVSATCCWSTA